MTKKAVDFLNEPYDDNLAKVVGIFLAVISLLAVYANTMGSDFSGKSGSQVGQATRDMLNATDQWAYYQAHKLRMTVFESQFIFNFAPVVNDSNVSLFAALAEYENAYQQNVNASANFKKQLRTDFLSHLTEGKSVSPSVQLVANDALSGIEKSIQKSNDGSIAATAEEAKFSQLMASASKNGAYGGKYSFNTTLFVVTITLGGIANITKRRFLAYVAILMGVAGILHLLLLVFSPAVLGLPV